MHFRFLSSTLSLAFGALALPLLISGCSAGDEGVGGGTGSSNSGSGSTGNGSNNGSGGIDFGTGGSGSGSTGPNGKEYCQEAAVDFIPQTPTVFVLVDRSGSMFGGGTPNLWTSVRDAVLPVIQTLEADVRFGIGAYNSVDGACADVVQDQGTIAENNFAAIQTFYTGLSTTPPAGKIDTPTAIAIEQTVEILKADNGPGAKAILLVTSDDDPDYCDDVGQECGNDGIIGALQAAHAAGVQTFIFGLDNSDIQHKDWFDFWAQAGAGEQPNWTTGLTKDQYSGAVYNACSNNAAWKKQWTDAGRSGFDPIGLYSSAGGASKAFVSADTGAVAEEISSKVEGLKSCTFDLGASNVEVKPGSESQGDIFVNDELIPKADWKLNSATSLELLGASCEKWKDPTVTKFFAGFPCDALIIK